MNDYFHKGMPRAVAVAMLTQLQEEDEDEAQAHMLFRTSSEPGVYALSTISDTGKIRHFKVRELNQRLGVCEAGGVKEYMDVHMFLHAITNMGLGALARSPRPRPLFP